MGISKEFRLSGFAGGRADLPLAAEGRRQAEATAHRTHTPVRCPDPGKLQTRSVGRLDWRRNVKPDTFAVHLPKKCTRTRRTEEY